MVSQTASSSADAWKNFYQRASSFQRYGIWFCKQQVVLQMHGTMFRKQLVVSRDMEYGLQTASADEI